MGSLTTDLVPASKRETMAPSKCNIKRNIRPHLELLINFDLKA